MEGLCDFTSYILFIDDNIDETYGVNVQFESDEEVRIFVFLIRIGVLTNTDM